MKICLERLMFAILKDLSDRLNLPLFPLMFHLSISEVETEFLNPCIFLWTYSIDSLFSSPPIRVPSKTHSDCLRDDMDLKPSRTRKASDFRKSVSGFHICFTKMSIARHIVSSTKRGNSEAKLQTIAVFELTSELRKMSIEAGGSWRENQGSP